MKNRHRIVLLVGDILALAMVTFFGFTRHGEISSAGLRVLSTLIPLVLSWLMVAPFLGAYDLDKAADIRQLWRPFYAMVLAGPMAAWMRGVLLGNSPILPVFVLVIGGFSALAILAWRVLIWFFLFRKRPANG